MGASVMRYMSPAGDDGIGQSNGMPDTATDPMVCSAAKFMMEVNFHRSKTNRFSPTTSGELDSILQSFNGV